MTSPITCSALRLPSQGTTNLYWRPGSHRPAILAASAWALSASRNSSTKRTGNPLFDLGLGEGGELVGVRLADPLEELQRGPGFVLVDLGQGEADVDEHPVARLQRLALQQADVDDPLGAAHVDLGKVG